MDETPKGYIRMKSAGGTCNRCLEAIPEGDVALWHPNKGLRHTHPCEPAKDTLESPSGLYQNESR